MTKRVIVALTGASGAIYFERTARALLLGGHHVDLVVSNYGQVTLKDETDYSQSEGSVVDWLRHKYPECTGEVTVHGFRDQTSAIASGSGVRHGMVIVPCTMKTLAGVAHGLSSNLIERAADVVLKERRRLVLVPREAPFNLMHVRNMAAVMEAGGSVVPANPAFYQKPKTFDDLGDFIAQRVLALLDIEVDLFARWEGLGGQTPSGS